MGTHFADPTLPRARKQHRCIACYTPIVIGEIHVCQSGHYEDRAFRYRFHIECWNVLAKDGDFEFTPGEHDPPHRPFTEQARAGEGE